MKKIAQILGRILLVFYLIFVHIFAALFIYQTYAKPYFAGEDTKVENVPEPAETGDVPTPLPPPSSAETQVLPAADTDSNLNSNVNPGNNNVADSSSEASLMIPVVGIKRDQLQDTYDDARSEGRVHNAIDIIAPVGTSVAAAADGEIVKFFDSVRGGTTIYQFSPDKHFIYYYAHLQKRAENLKEHDFVKRGTVIGYVGDTGDAGAGNYHLHFEVMIAQDPNKYWKGTDVNPYPLLKSGIESH